MKNSEIEEYLELKDWYNKSMIDLQNKFHEENKEKVKRFKELERSVYCSESISFI